MALCVKSEVAKLKKVLLHRPGKELEHLVPESMSRLLFDDIPFLDIACKEHDYFAGILKENGAELVYLEDLVAEVLGEDTALRQHFIEEFIERSDDIAKAYSNELMEFLLDIKDAKELVIKTMVGVNMNEIKSKRKSKLSGLLRSDSSFLLDPIPNLYFTRDPFTIIGKGVSLNRMYSTTRMRESIYGKYIFRYHPDFYDTSQYYSYNLPYSIEGGDIINLSEKAICVGISQRTSPEGVELLANNILKDESSTVEKVLAIEIPHTRAFMHLDTVFTQIDTDKFLVHPQIINTLRFFEISLDSENELKIEEKDKSLADILAEYLQLDKVQLIYCGGKDSIASAREQWNDGSNTLCISPGKVVVYERNTVTNQILENMGLDIIKIHSSELSRGRGGPHCMTMPLIREN